MSNISGIYPTLETLAERLTFAHDHQLLSQKIVADMAGMSQPTYSNLLSGKNKSTKSLAKIAEVLNVDYQWLVTGVPSEEANNSNTLINLNLLDYYDQYINTKQRCVIKPPAPFVQFDIKALKNSHINYFDVAYIPMTDKGMSPAIKENASVFFDRSKNFIEDGEEFVFVHGGILQVRQLFNAPLGGVKIQASNPNFENIVLSEDEQIEQIFQIIGKVFAVINYY